MNRRGFLSLVPSVSVFSIVDVDPRKLYMQYVFPSRFKVRKVVEDGTTYYDAICLEDHIQFNYMWNSDDREHRIRIRVFDEDILDTHTVIEAEVDSISGAVEELQEDLVIPSSIDNVDKMRIDYQSLLDSDIATEGEFPYTLD